MEVKDSWQLLRLIENFIIRYDWEKYGIDVTEAYDKWRECYQFSRESQLNEYGLESIAPSMSNNQKDYENAMTRRIISAIKNYIESYVKIKQPKGTDIDFESNIVELIQIYGSVE